MLVIKNAQYKHVLALLPKLIGLPAVVSVGQVLHITLCLYTGLKKKAGYMHTVKFRSIHEFLCADTEFFSVVETDP